MGLNKADAHYATLVLYVYALAADSCKKGFWDFYVSS